MRCASRTTPLGAFTLAEAGGAIVRVWLPGETPRQGRDAATPLLEQAFRELEEFLAGIRRRFTVPLAPSGTPFQRAVWRAIDAIPYAQTATYAELAARIGRPFPHIGAHVVQAVHSGRCGVDGRGAGPGGRGRRCWRPAGCGPWSRGRWCHAPRA